MNELNELFEKYTLLLEKSNNYLNDFLNNFPSLDLSNDILSQLSRDKLKRLEYMIPKLELTNQESLMVKNVFDYYYLNSDLNLSDLIIQDENYENFIQFIKNIYIKALKYKKDVTTKLEFEQKKYQSLLQNIKNIQELIKIDKEIDIKLLVSYLKELPLTRDSILEITTMVLEKNLRLYQKIKVTKEVEEKEETNPDESMIVDEEIDYNSILSIYPRKLSDFISKIERDNNYQGEKYETLAKLVVLRDKLTEIREDYNFAMEDPEYFKNDIPELFARLRKIADDIDDTIDNYIATNTEELAEEKAKPVRDLIILGPSLKDLDIFKKGICSGIISKNLNRLIHSLRYDEVLYGMPTWFESQTPVMKLKAPRTTGGTPRLFYQLIDKDKAVVLMLGIEGKNNYNYFKQCVESRLRGYEFTQLIKAIRLGTDKPDEISPYNSQLTNKAYLDSIFLHYKEQENEFLDKFATECYTNSMNVR